MTISLTITSKLRKIQPFFAISMCSMDNTSQYRQPIL